MNLTELLKLPHLRKFYLARFISNFGNGMAPIALAFGILNLPDGSATRLGLVLGIQSIVIVIMMPFGGVIADRYGQARLVAVTDLIWGALVLLQAFWFSTGDVPLIALILLNATGGVLIAIWWPAFSAILPALVPDKVLQKSNAITSLFSNASIVLGAAVSGILISAFGAALVLAIDACTFIFAGVLVYSFRHINLVKEAIEFNVLEDLRNGWQVFISFRWIVIITSAYSFVFLARAAAENILGPVVAIKNFNGAKSWSIVLVAESIGLIVGSIFAAKIRPKRPMLVFMVTTSTLALYIWSLANPQALWFISTCAFIWGITFEFGVTLYTTAMQKQVPRESLSRVSAYDTMATLLFQPVGLAVAGPLSDLIGIEQTLYAGAILVLVAILISISFSEVRNVRD